MPLVNLGGPSIREERDSMMFRVSQLGEGIDDADTIEGARAIVRGRPPGRYEVDEIRAEPFPTGHTSRSWGRMLRHPDGRVEEEPSPWDREGE
jgi:hypothetical protein